MGTCPVSMHALQTAASRCYPIHCGRNGRIRLTIFSFLVHRCAAKLTHALLRLLISQYCFHAIDLHLSAINTCVFLSPVSTSTSQRTLSSLILAVSHWSAKQGTLTSRISVCTAYKSLIRLLSVSVCLDPFLTRH